MKVEKKTVLLLKSVFPYTVYIIPNVNRCLGKLGVNDQIHFGNTGFKQSWPIFIITRLLQTSKMLIFIVTLPVGDRVQSASHNH